MAVAKKTEVRVDVSKLNSISAKKIKELESVASPRYEGEFTKIREAKSGSVQLALTSWDEAGDEQVKKLMKQAEDSLLFHVSSLEYDALKEDNMVSKFFIRANQTGTRLYISLDNETSNTRKENRISVSGMSKLLKPAPTNKFAVRMAQQIAAFRSGAAAVGLSSIQSMISAQGNREVTASV